ncbi:MAG: hypothetical protein LGB06_05785 [Sulfurovum sp.]|nr:hypothetical protein [Sulfurovum sp.]
MIKQKTLVSMSASVLVLVTALSAQTGMKCQAGKCGGAMFKTMKIHKEHKRKSSPFLIKHGLPHFTKMLMKSWDDPQLKLTKVQKNKLLEIRKMTMGSVIKLKPEIITLRKEIVQASKSGTKPNTLKSRVEKLAQLEVKATMTHLKCIEETKAVLSKEQVAYLMQKQKQKMASCHQKYKCKGMKFK